MALDQSYLDQIKGMEGYADSPSWDYKQYSSGYGTKAQPGDENIPANQRQAVYEQRFQDQIGKASASVDAFAPDAPAGVKAALSSLTYNAGPGWQQSGLGDAVKAGDWNRAQQIFLQYNHAGGQVNPGLTARRQQEAGWFGGGLPGAPQTVPVNSPSPAIAPPQGQPPIFAGQPVPQQAAPQEAASQAAPDQSLLAQMQPMQFQFARPHQVDLSKLRAQLQRAPIFART